MQSQIEYWLKEEQSELELFKNSTQCQDEVLRIRAKIEAYERVLGLFRQELPTAHETVSSADEKMSC